jgi:hypothetical protein
MRQQLPVLLIRSYPRLSLHFYWLSKSPKYGFYETAFYVTLAAVLTIKADNEKNMESLPNTVARLLRTAKVKSLCLIKHDTMSYGDVEV